MHLKAGYELRVVVFPQMLVFIIEPELERGLRCRSGVMRMGFCG